MKAYKTSEAIAMLEKNPMLVFESTYEGDKRMLKCSDTGYVEFERYFGNEKQKAEYPCARFNGNVNLFDDVWTLVQQPVSFMEAVKAYYSELKTIRCEINGEIYKYVPSDDGWRGMCPEDVCAEGISPKEILEGTWYIEDGEQHE